MLVAALFVVQVLLGMVTAHYAVEGQGIYGLPFAEYFPYAVTRTRHTQLAVLGSPPPRGSRPGSMSDRCWADASQNSRRRACGSF